MVWAIKVGLMTETTHFGSRQVPLDEKQDLVDGVFHSVAHRYDLMNDILSMGQVRLWRKRVQRILQAGPGDRVLDLAAGTGTSSVTFTAFSSGTTRSPTWYTDHAFVNSAPKKRINDE